ncbi:hypothetical protein [Pontixanthobacter aquaemixtae]|uniref:hypothetical protein n=1 Tax=Pontixanthobacter aquaemixtae TaxID=1958940 RepID=UPI001369509C|nr:hypothetical protein [Pontixanthobacter aquaemixtae]
MALFLASCADNRGAELDRDTHAIIATVLALQADIPVENEKWFSEHPEEKPNFYGWFDHRLCVARELAGTTAEIRMARNSVQANGGTTDFGLNGKRQAWESASKRSVLPSDIKPEHLRWDGALKYCLNGVLWMSHPEIDGDDATIFIQNECSGWCGWGGVYELKRTKAGWELGDKLEGWMS